MREGVQAELVLSVDNPEQYPLHAAACRLDYNATRDASALLESGRRVDEQDPLGRTALHYAAWAGDMDMIELLVKAGASKDAEDSEGRTPLNMAQRGKIVCCRMEGRLVSGTLRNNAFDYLRQIIREDPSTH